MGVQYSIVKRDKWVSLALPLDHVCFRPDKIGNFRLLVSSVHVMFNRLRGRKMGRKGELGI